MTRMLASGMFSARATPVCTANTPCVDSQMVRRGPSHLATHPWSSIAFCSSHGVVKVCSITTSADLKPASTSPRMYRLAGRNRIPAVTNRRRARLQRVRDRGDLGQDLVVDLDRAHGVPRLVNRVGGHDGHLVAFVAAVRIEQPAREPAAAREPRHVRADVAVLQDGPDARHLLGRGRVHFPDHGVGMRAREDRRMEHVGEPDIRRVLRGAADPVVGIDADHGLPDDRRLRPTAPAPDRARAPASREAGRSRSRVRHPSWLTSPAASDRPPSRRP